MHFFSSLLEHYRKLYFMPNPQDNADLWHSWVFCKFAELSQLVTRTNIGYSGSRKPSLQTTRRSLNLLAMVMKIVMINITTKTYSGGFSGGQCPPLTNGALRSPRQFFLQKEIKKKLYIAVARPPLCCKRNFNFFFFENIQWRSL